MSRHRNIRGRDFTEEYDDFNYDQYGRSLEEDFSVSPGTANQYLFDRQNSSSSGQLEQTHDDNDVTNAKINSSIEFIQNMIGDARTEEEIRDALKRTHNDPELALDLLLNGRKLSNIIQQQKQQPQKQTEDLGYNQKPSSNVPESKLFKAFTTEYRSSVPLNIMEYSDQRYNFRKFIKEFMLKSLKQISKNRDKTPTKTKAHSNTTKCDDNKIQQSNVKAKQPSISPQPPQQTSSKLSTETLGSIIPPSPRTFKQNIKQKPVEDIMQLYERKRLDSSKLQLNLVIVGHVDAGKSTIMGHLLALLGNVSKKNMHKNETEAKKAGKASFMYAWVLDETEEERNRGITIDVAQHCFETNKRIVNILDAPGHRDFIPNMITGTTKADIAMLVVDATNGEFESGFDQGGQTQEHILLLRSFGITQVAIAINKMDNVKYSKERYDEIVEKIRKFLKQVGFKDGSVEYIPCSGITGDNLLESSKNPLFQWYNGPTLIDIIDNFQFSSRLVDRPFRMAISDIFRGQTSGQYLAGRIDYGYVECNQKLLLMPNNEIIVVKNIVINDQNQPEAFAGDVVAINIPSIDGSLEISVGNVICDIGQPCTLASKFEARIVIFNTIETPIIKGTSILIYSVCLSNEVGCITKLCSLIDKSKNEVIKRNPRLLTKNQAAIVQITTTRPVCIETFENCKEYGRLVFRLEHTTLGTGIVTKILAG